MDRDDTAARLVRGGALRPARRRRGVDHLHRRRLVHRARHQQLGVEPAVHRGGSNNWIDSNFVKASTVAQHTVTVDQLMR